jgi:3-dehydroquinate synthase
MQRLSIHSSIRPYTVYIGEKIRFKLTQLLTKDYSSILIITDSNVSELYASDVVTSLPQERVFVEVVKAGENAKSLETYYHLQTKAIDYGLDRESLIIALGGGVIGDLAGFVAATFMRGIDFVQMPTTILAHDSSVGGKVAINHEKGKNLIGSFYPPVMVLYDTETLKTLPTKEVRSGFAEIIKEAMLADSEMFQKLLSVSLTDLSTEALNHYIEAGIRIKAKIVEADEKETGNRKLLNLGHTLGHALEAKLGYGELTHGEAVAVGLLFMLYVSKNELDANLPEETLRKWFDENGYSIPLRHDMADDLLELIKHDKKTVNQTIQMILLKNVAEPVIQAIEAVKLKGYLDSFITYIEKR